MRILLVMIWLIVVSFDAASQKMALLPANRDTIPDYEHLVKFYRYSKQDSAIYWANYAISIAQQQGDSMGVANFLLQLGMIDDNQGEFDSAQQRYTHAIAIYKKAKFKKGIASATIRLGVVDLRNGKYDNAVSHFLEALKLSEEVADKFGAMEANYSISWAWLDQKDYERALQYLLLAEAIDQNIPFSNISLNIYNHFGVIYRETGKYSRAKEYLQKGIEKSNTPEYQGLNITLINNLAAVYAKEGNKEKAIALQEEALKRSREIGNYLRELQTLLGLSKTYGKDNPDKAIFYITQAVTLARQKKSPKQEIRFLKILTELYKTKGDFKEALVTKERELVISDSFFSQSTARNIASLKAEYELEKSNARIIAMDLQSKERQLDLKHSNTLIMVTLAGIGLLLVILGLLYKQYVIKKKNSTQLNSKNLSLERLVDEKEWLLREVHHRVKNNLHTIMSLLETQSAYLKDDALAAIQNSQHRVYAMSLIHQKLYQNEGTSIIDMSTYLPELISYLAESYGSSQHISIQTRIDHVTMDISQAIPAGLIINEAITNSIKYAFPAGKKGVVTVELTVLDDKRVQLLIADNGIGLPGDWQQLQKNSLGIKLMKGLSDDLRADFNITTGTGTKIEMKFKREFYTRTMVNSQ